MAAQPYLNKSSGHLFRISLAVYFNSEHGKERRKMSILQHKFPSTHHFNCISTSSSMSHNLYISLASNFTWTSLHHLGLSDLSKETGPLLCLCQACVHSTSDSADPQESDTEMLTDEQHREIRGKNREGKKKIFLLQALFVGSWYCHNNIWRPSCRFTELGCAFGWSIFPQMTLAGLLCEELTNLWSWKSGCWAVVCCNVSVKNQSERFEQVLRAGMRRSGLGCRKMEHNFKFTEDLHGIFLCGYPINPSRVEVNLLVQCGSSRKHESIKNSVIEDAIYDFLLRAQRSCHDFWVQIPSNRKQWLTLQVKKNCLRFFASLVGRVTCWCAVINMCLFWVTTEVSKGIRVLQPKIFARGQFLKTPPPTFFMTSLPMSEMLWWFL